MIYKSFYYNKTKLELIITISDDTGFIMILIIPLPTYLVDFLIGFKYYYCNSYLYEFILY